MVKRAVNYHEIDDAIPDQRASIIKLDNAEEEALNILAARGKKKQYSQVANRM